MPIPCKQYPHKVRVVAFLSFRSRHTILLIQTERPSCRGIADVSVENFSQRCKDSSSIVVLTEKCGFYFLVYFVYSTGTILAEANLQPLTPVRFSNQGLTANGTGTGEKKGKKKNR